MKWYWWLLIIYVGHLVIATAEEFTERHRKYKEAKEYAEMREKPLLVVGDPMGSKICQFFSVSLHPCGDYTLDVDPHVAKICPVNPIVADVRQIPFPDSFFGAAFASHTLEHLESLDELEKAWNELNRVADKVWVCSPVWWTINNTANPDHPLIISQEENGDLIAYRNRGFGNFIPSERGEKVRLTVVGKGI